MDDISALKMCQVTKCMNTMKCPAFNTFEVKKSHTLFLKTVFREMTYFIFE